MPPIRFASSGQTTLASGLTYSGDAGAAGMVTGATLNGISGAPLYSASYDDDLRLVSSSIGLPMNEGGGLYYELAQVGYDAASNVTGLDTTLSNGTLAGTRQTDNQSFCYDEQNRLVWAASVTAVGPNNCASNSAGTLTGGNALYTATYAYDTLDRLTSGPAGSTYTYGDPNHLHAATATSGGYSASYDASGDMVCRAPTSATTCAGTQTGWTGAQLAYDNEGRLTSWQNQPGSSPTSTDAFAYDGEGSRVAQKAVSTGVTTTTDYLLGGLEEVTGSTLTEYYPIPGIGTAVRVGTTLSYLASDNLGSVTVALSSSGSVEAQQLYGPYGGVRYSSGTMPTAHGYTGQIADAQTGLSYYGARYYDPTLGQFASADTVLDGLNRYAYVGGNPETATDPTGHLEDPEVDQGGVAVVAGPGTPSETETSGQVSAPAWQGVLITAAAAAVTLLGLAALAIYEDANPLIRIPMRAAQNVLNHKWGPMAGAAVRWGDGLDYAPKIKSAYIPKGGSPPPPPPPPPGPGPQPTPTGFGSGESDPSTASSDVQPATSTNGAWRGRGRCNDPAVIAAALCVYFQQQQTGYGCAGVCLVRGSIGTTSPYFTGTGRQNNSNHAETQAGRWVEEELLGTLAQSGDVLQVDIISALYPCSYGCRTGIPLITQQLSGLAAGMGVTLEMHWWFLNQYDKMWPWEFGS